MSKFDVSSFSLTEIYSFKLVIFLTLSSSKLIVILLLWLSLDWFYVFILILWASHSCFTSLGKMLDCEKQSKPPMLDKSSGTTHRVWYKAFSMIQSTKIKNWIPQLISRLERVSLWIPFCNTFFDLSHKIKYAW